MHVLVVEDEPLVARLTTRLLASLGHTSDWVASAEEALQRLAAEGYELVLCDRQLPGLSGTALLATARERWPGLACVLVTGWGAQGELPGVVVLAKPFDRGALQEAIARARAVN
ncbi:MAG: response regulator [Armatimonadetes bacterium]|nr:response regulator [Armatimonadota bacterium]